MRSVWLGSTLLALAAGKLGAQDAYPWRISDFPYVLGDPTNGVMAIGHIQYAREADYDARVPYDGIVTLEGGWGSRSSRFLTARLCAPGLVAGWRIAADAGAVREGKFGFYGLGPDGEANLTNPGGDADFFRVHRSRYFGRAEVTRSIVGPLQAALAGELTYFRFTPLAGSDAYHTEFFDAPLTGTDAIGRLALVVDTRDRELVPTRGLLLEAGVYAGSGRFEERHLAPGGGGPVASFSPRGYAAGYAHLRGYFSPRGGTTLAARLGVRGMGKNAPLDARYQLPGWERDITVFGGAESNRGLIKGRLVGRGLLFGSAEIRHNLLDVGDYGAVTLIAFLDGGRLFDGAPTLTLAKWKVGGGGGLALRVLRSALLTFNFATGPDGFTFSTGTAWAF